MYSILLIIHILVFIKYIIILDILKKKTAKKKSEIKTANKKTCALKKMLPIL